MKLYAVFAEAIYRHECAGIFSTLEKAKAVARERMVASDGHHDYVVYEFDLDTPLPFSGNCKNGTGISEEGNRVFGLEYNDHTKKFKEIKL